MGPSFWYGMEHASRNGQFPGCFKMVNFQVVLIYLRSLLTCFQVTHLTIRKKTVVGLASNRISVKLRDAATVLTKKIFPGVITLIPLSCVSQWNGSAVLFTKNEQKSKRDNDPCELVNLWQKIQGSVLYQKRGWWDLLFGMAWSMLPEAGGPL